MIRRACKNDIPKIMDLLLQVGMIHHNGRPDIFKANSTKYTAYELQNILNDDNTPVFVYLNDKDKVVGYAFCVFQQHVNNNILTNIKTLYIDDLCVDEMSRGEHVGSELYNYILKYAKENMCYNVTLNVWACNKSALMFYEKLGLSKQKIGMEFVL